MNHYVFLGPSLDINEAQKLLTAKYLPPVKMGDVYKVCKKKPASILIIDGLFEQTPAVWHKEILYALSLGIPVFGASSMGALRAAELVTFGMVGIGDIFEGYALNVLEDDDEVAIVHSSDDDYLYQSTAMINIRYGIQSAIDRSIISESLGEQVISELKATFYPERSWTKVLELIQCYSQNSIEYSDFKLFIENEQPNKKKDDAIKALKHIKSLFEKSYPKRIKHQPSFTFEHTISWDIVERYFGSVDIENSDDIDVEHLRNHTRIFIKDREIVRKFSLLYILIEQEANRLGIAVDDEKIAMRNFRYRRGLQSKKDLIDWMTNNSVSKEECIELSNFEAKCLLLETRYIEQVDSKLSSVLKLNNLYQSTCRDVIKKWTNMSKQGIKNITEEHFEETQDVITWYKQTYGTSNLNFDLHIQELGFGNRRQFLHELYSQFIFLTEESGNGKDNVNFERLTNA